MVKLQPHPQPPHAGAFGLGEASGGDAEGERLLPEAAAFAASQRAAMASATSARRRACCSSCLDFTEFTRKKNDFYQV